MKITGDCPNCKKEIAIDIDKLDVKQEKPLEFVGSTTTAAQTIQVEKPKSEIQIQTVAPKDQPFYKCKNCGDKHKNPNYSKRPNKKCSKCGSLNGETSCKNCDNNDSEEFEEIDEDKLDDMGIPKPEPHEHNHEHE